MAEGFLSPEEMQRALQDVDSKLRKMREERERASKQDKMKEQIEKMREENERIKREQLEDAQREGRERSKLMKELREGPKKRKDPLLEPAKRVAPEEKTKQQREVERFLEKNRELPTTPGVPDVVRKQPKSKPKPQPKPKPEPKEKPSVVEGPSEEKSTVVEEAPPKKTFTPQPGRPKDPMSQREQKKRKKQMEEFLKSQRKKEEGAPAADPKREKAIEPYVKKIEKNIESLSKKKDTAVKKDQMDKARDIEEQQHELEKEIRKLKMWSQNRIPTSELNPSIADELWEATLTKEEKELLSNPEYVQQDIKDMVCMNHPDRPAVLLLKHNGALDEEAPPIPLCEEDALKIKLTPIMENDPSEALLKRLSFLANQLDKKGLYKEADVVDAVLLKFAAQMERASNGIGVSTSSRKFVRQYYSSWGWSDMASMRNQYLNEILAKDFLSGEHVEDVKFRDGSPGVIRKSNNMYYIAAYRNGNYDIITIKTNIKPPREKKQKTPGFVPGEKR